MTLFNDQTTPEGTTPEGALESLVGEGKKFKSVEDLAKGKIESDKHILQTQSENKNMREKILELEQELQQRRTIEDFLAEIKTVEQNEEVTTPPSPAPVRPGVADRQRPEINIDKLIDDKLQQQRRREAAQANVSVVETELKKHLGDDFRSKIIQKAKDLNLSHEFLGSVAEQSPKAFLEFMGIRQEPRTDPNADVPVTTRQQSVIDLSSTGVRNKSFYDKLKKQNPRGQLTEQQRQQMHRDAQRLGESFFQ